MYKRLFEAVGIDTNNENLKLMKAPQKDEEGAFKNKTLRAGAVCQADLTFWSNDDGFKYLLTIVDNVDRSIDAEPLRSKDSTAIKNAFNKIFARDYIKPTFKILQTDPGSEFKNAVIRRYFEEKNISMRYGRTGRSNQQAIIEHYNGIIGKVIGNSVGLSEIETGRLNRRWRGKIPDLIKTLNDEYRKSEPSLDEFLKPVKQSTYKDGKTLLKIGTLVHVKLEQAASTATGEKEHGRFRQGDLRWTKEKHKIVNILMIPNSYPRYIVEGFPTTSFSRREIIL